MNNEIQKSFVLKLAGLSIAAGLGWYTAVGPQLVRVQEAKQAQATQNNDISQGEEAIALFADQVQTSIDLMSDVQNMLTIQLDIDRATDAHKHLQDAAEANSLMVSRIEPLNTSTKKRISQVDMSFIELETREFRVECVGPYDGIIGYLSTLSNGPNIARINSFKLTPVSSQYAQLILQVSFYQLTDIPEAFTKSFSTSATKIKDTGEPDDQA